MNDINIHRQPITDTQSAWIKKLSILVQVDEELLLGCATRDYKRFRYLFNHHPSEVNKNLERIAELVGVDKSELVKTACHFPQLFMELPEKMNTNITGTAEILGVDKTKYVQAALKHHSLFSSSPEKIDRYITRSAQGLGISKEDYIEFAWGHPALFYQNPETIVTHGDIIRRMVDAAQDAEQPDSAEAFLKTLKTHPLDLCRSNNALHGRYIVVQQKMTPLTPGTVCNRTNSVIEGLITEHYKNKIRTTGKGRLTLQRLHAKGVISHLPEDIDPIDPPAPRSR